MRADTALLAHGDQMEGRDLFALEVDSRFAGMDPVSLGVARGPWKANRCGSAGRARNPARRFLPTLLAGAMGLLLAGCGGSRYAEDPPPPPAKTTFVFRLHGKPGSEEFRISTESQEFIGKARAQLGLPEGQRRLFPTGPIEAGNGGHNGPWSWHYSHANLTEMAVELCDGTPSMVEADLPYWLGTVGYFCPWNAYVYAETP